MSNLYLVNPGLPNRSDIYSKSEGSLCEHTECGLMSNLDLTKEINILDDSFQKYEIKQLQEEIKTQGKKIKTVKEEINAVGEKINIVEEEIKKLSVK